MKLSFVGWSDSILQILSVSLEDAGCSGAQVLGHYHTRRENMEVAVRALHAEQTDYVVMAVREPTGGRG